MNLYWLVYRTPNGPTVFIQPAHSLIAARLRAAIANVEGGFTEGYQLAGKIEQRVPKKLIGHPLSRTEAAKLLKRFEQK